MGRVRLFRWWFTRVEKNILYNSAEYPVIRGTGGLRKMRFALEGLITVYPKNVKDNLTLAERREIKKLIGYLCEELEGWIYEWSVFKYYAGVEGSNRWCRG